jgi:hypothetical protein
LCTIDEVLTRMAETERSAVLYFLCGAARLREHGKHGGRHNVLLQYNLCSNLADYIGNQTTETPSHIKHLPFLDNDNETTHRTITHVPSEKSTSPTHTQSCFETFVLVNLRKIDLRSLLQPSSLCHTPHSHQVYTSASHLPSKSNIPRILLRHTVIWR